MKKLLAVLLALMMVFSLTSVLAEEPEKTVIYFDDGLSFGMLFPEGYEAKSDVDKGIMTIEITSGNLSEPNFIMIVAPDPDYDEVQRLNDLSDKEIEEFALSMMEDLTSPSFEIRETGLGSKLIVVNEQNAEYDVVILASVYMGYLLFTYVGHADGSEVTRDDIDLGIQIYTDMDFITK